MRKFPPSKGVSRRGVLAFCLALVLTLSLVPQALGLISGGTEEGSPTVTVAAVGVDNTYVEVGLNIQAQANGFRSVGAVLSYDPSLLTPVQWGENAETVTVHSAAADGDTYTEEEARTDWNGGVTALPAKGPDELSGKTALAYVKGETAGYLYLSAEAPRLLNSWYQTLPDVTPLTAGDGGTAETTANGVPVVAPVTAPLAAPVEQSIVVRFKLNDPEAENAMAAALASIDLVKDAAAKGSPIYDESGVAYFHNDQGESLAVNVRILRAEVGVTYFTGGGGGGGPADPSDFVSITMYDWDDALLGAVVVPKGSDATEIIKQFVQERSATAEQLAGGLYYADSSLPFTNKRGYSFDMVDYGVWLSYDSETLTHYGSEVQGVMLPKPTTETGAVDLTAVNENLIMKACYGANSELHTGTGADGRYTTSILSTERVAGDVFIVTIRVKRENTVDGNAVGVVRLGEPIVRVRMTSGTVTVPSRVVMTTSDEVVIQTVPSKLVDEYAYVVVDAYQFDNWPGAGIKSTEDGAERGTVVNNLISGGAWTGESYSGSGFLYEGTLVYINKNLQPDGNTSFITQPILDEMKLDYSMVSAMPPMPIFQANAAVRHLQTAFNTLNGITAGEEKPEYIGLTYKQMQYAIANSGALLTENID